MKQKHQQAFLFLQNSTVFCEKFADTCMSSLEKH